MTTFSFYTQASWKAVQLSLRGQDGCSVPAFQAWNTHTFRTNSQPQILPDKGLFPSVHRMGGGWRERKDGATENSAPCQHPSPKGTPNQLPCLEPVSLANSRSPDHLLCPVIPRPNPPPQLSLDLGDRHFRGRGSLEPKSMWCLWAWPERTRAALSAGKSSVRPCQCAGSCL